MASSARRLGGGLRVGRLGPCQSPTGIRVRCRVCRGRLGHVMRSWSILISAAVIAPLRESERRSERSSRRDGGGVAVTTTPLLPPGEAGRIPII